MKLETRLRLESDFDKKLKEKIANIASISASSLPLDDKNLKYEAKAQELVNYIRLQVSMAYKLGVKAGKGESEL